MSWILPTKRPSIKGKARTIGEPDYLLRRREAVKRWWASGKGQEYLEKNKDKIQAYEKERRPKRRQYLTDYMRGWRARRKSIENRG